MYRGSVGEVHELSICKQDTTASQLKNPEVLKEIAIGAQLIAYRGPAA
ncbi:MAG: hypothetical protein ACREEK_21910 [Bradyrhizobium sp.]